MHAVKAIHHSMHLKLLKETLVLAWNGIILLNRVRLINQNLYQRISIVLEI